MIWAVLSGDIVESSRLAPEELDALMDELDKAAWHMSGWDHSEADRAETALFARRGGDGWQIALNRPKYALRAALYVQAALRSFDDDQTTRIAVAIGEGTLPDRPGADLNSASGPAFQKSGRLLASLSGRQLVAFADNPLLDAALQLAGHISLGWTQAQARAVSVMLQPGSGPRRVAAEKLGISRQAVDQALWSAGYPAIDAALTRIEKSPHD